MTAVLLNEMCSVAAAVILRERYGHHAVQVSEVGRRATADATSRPSREQSAVRW